MKAWVLLSFSLFLLVVLYLIETVAGYIIPNYVVFIDFALIFYFIGGLIADLSNRKEQDETPTINQYEGELQNAN